MALIVMCCHDTEENGRTKYTRETLISLKENVGFGTGVDHDIVIVDNNSCDDTKDLIRNFDFSQDNSGFKALVITCEENIGTAKGINLGIKKRHKGQHVCKIDNDVVIHQKGWLCQLEEVVKRDPSIGIVGLKRKDLRQTPYDPDPNFRSELRQLPHAVGEPWIVVEETADIMGTCTLLSSDLLDQLGGYSQPLVYGFDDTLLNLRAGLAGFKKCFLPHIDIDHIDDGSNGYSQEKAAIANEAWPIYHQWHEDYLTGRRPLFEQI